MAVLYLFRKIYGEVVGALPLNGGAYNVLLNTTSKSNASVAACLTILSYMATAVISSSEAMHYLHHILPYFNVNIATFVLLLIFLGLTILGISESAVVALVIFIFHLTTMALLIGSCAYFVFENGFTILMENFHLPVKNGSIMTAIFSDFQPQCWESQASKVHQILLKSRREVYLPKHYVICGLLFPY